MNEITQKVCIHHPVTRAVYEAELPVSITIRELNRRLSGDGFIRPRRDYQFIINDRLCLHAYPLEYFIPDPAPDRLEIFINAELAIFA